MVRLSEMGLWPTNKFGRFVTGKSACAIDIEISISCYGDKRGMTLDNAIGHIQSSIVILQPPLTSHTSDYLELNGTRPLRPKSQERFKLNFMNLIT